MRVGRLDVDKMLAEMTPGQFEELWAMQLIDGWGDEWMQAGTIAAAGHNAAVLTSGAEVTQSMLHDPADYVPRACRPPGAKPAARKLTAAESEAMAKARYG